MSIFNASQLFSIGLSIVIWSLTPNQSHAQWFMLGFVVAWAPLCIGAIYRIEQLVGK